MGILTVKIWKPGFFCIKIERAMNDEAIVACVKTGTMIDCLICFKLFSGRPSFSSSL